MLMYCCCQAKITIINTMHALKQASKKHKAFIHQSKAKASLSRSAESPPHDTIQKMVPVSFSR
jgi:hypothetical protein